MTSHLAFFVLLFDACGLSDARLDRTTEGGDPGPDDVPIDTDPVDDSGDSPDTADSSPAPITDTFTYARPKVDVLFIVDNSSSMKSLNGDLADAIAPAVASWIAHGIDFHAGVVDIDANAWVGELEEHDGARWADDTLADPADTLTRLVKGVADASSNETGRRAARLALQFAADGQPNAGFLRDDAELDIIVHSDGDDASEDDPSSDDFVAYLRELRPDPAFLHFHAIADSPDFTDLTDEIGGATCGVGDAPYDPTFEEATAMFHRTNVFPLTEPPDPATIAVSVGQIPRATAFRYDADANTVDLDGVPLAEGEVVRVSYSPPVP